MFHRLAVCSLHTLQDMHSAIVVASYVSVSQLTVLFGIITITLEQSSNHACVEVYIHACVEV